MRNGLYAVVATMVLIFAPPAHADEPVVDSQIDQWVQVARDYWQADPSCPVTVVRAQWLADPNVWGAAGGLGSCVIALDPDFYPRPEPIDAAYWRAEMCSIVVHEYGHLLGHDHTTAPRDMMNALVPINVVRGCPWFFRPPSAPSALRRVPDRPTRASGRRARKLHISTYRPARRPQGRRVRA